MLIGILSDTHDNLINLNKSIAVMKEKAVGAIVFCGDFCSPFAARALAESAIDVHAIFGNNDGDRFSIQKVVSTFSNFHLYGEYIGDLDSKLEIDGIKIAATHYPYYAKTMAKTGWYDCVFYGHNHVANKQKFGNCLLLNPGEVAGVLQPASFALYNTSEKSSDFIWL